MEAEMGVVERVEELNRLDPWEVQNKVYILSIMDVRSFNLEEV